MVCFNVITFLTIFCLNRGPSPFWGSKHEPSVPYSYLSERDVDSDSVAFW